MAIKSNSGQTLVEASFGIGILVTTFAGIAFIVYLSIFKTWITHVAYEAAICGSQNKPLLECKKKSEHQVQRFNFFKLPIVVDIKKQPASVHAQIGVEFAKSQHLQVSQKLILPLKPEYL